MFDDRLARPTICHATRAEGAWCVWLPSGKGKVTKHEELRSDKSQLQREWEKMETAATLTLQFKTCSAFGLLNMTSHLRRGGVNAQQQS